MENNTVILPLEDYNELRDFKKKIEEGKNVYKTSSINHFGFFHSENYILISESDAIKEISKANESLVEKVKYLEEKINQKTPNKNRKSILSFLIKQ